MRQYAADQVEIAWKGIDFSEGLAEGTFITETQTAVNFTQKHSAKGKAYRNFLSNRGGSLAVVVDQESQLHQTLKGIEQLDQDPATRNQVGLLKMKDLSSGEDIRYRNTYIAVVPNVSRGTESTTFTWTFNFEERLDKEVELTNQVGS